MAQRLDQRLAKRVEAAAADRDGGHDGQAQRLRQPLGIERQAVTLGEVDHVERHDDRHPQRLQLKDEAQVVVEIARVDDDEQRVGPPLARQLSEHHVARHALVGARRIEAVGAGQVDEFGRAPVGKRQTAGMPLDRDAGIVAHLLPRASEGVEQRRLAGIGIADQRDQGGGMH